MSLYSKNPALFVVGFDLDMTLGDTTVGSLASLEETGRETGTAIDLDAAKARLGIPIQSELAHHFSADEVDRATDIFRRHMGEVGVKAATVLPGARESVEHIKEIGGRRMVITNKQTALAEATLRHLGIQVDEIIGDCGGLKAKVLKEAKAWGYVGDHTNDMRDARMVDVRAVGVTTGNHSAEELRLAGAHYVLTTLEDFPALVNQVIKHQGR